MKYVFMQLESLKDFDRELEELKQILLDKVVVEELRTCIKRHKVFWVGRSDFDDEPLRVGFLYEDGRKYFWDWKVFATHPDRSKYLVMSASEADKLEQEILERVNLKKSKRKKG